MIVIERECIDVIELRLVARLVEHGAAPAFYLVSKPIAPSWMVAMARTGPDLKAARKAFRYFVDRERARLAAESDAA